MNPLSLDELRSLPAVVDIMTAARALGLSRTKAYDLAKQDQFPCRVLRIHHSYRVPAADLLRLLGIEPDSGVKEHAHPAHQRARQRASR